MRYRYPGFLKSFGARLGVGLADELLDRWFPPAPSFLQRFADAFVEQAPLILHLIERLAPPQYSAAEPESVAQTLGEFTCPKCGGHTWGTLGPATAPIVERYCTNGLETSYGPGLNPNTVKEPCMFRWKSTEDHLYFAKPSAEEAKRTSETQMCVAPPEATKVEQLADWDHAAKEVEAWGRPVLGLTPDAVENAYVSLAKAIGERFENAEESLATAATRIIKGGDAFIKKQSDKIAGLMLDNVFPPGKGEIGFLLTENIAKRIGLRYAPGTAPIRVSMVLDGWQWAVRLGLGHVGGELIRVDWDQAIEILHESQSAPKVDQTEMAQNAAGGVA